MERVKPKEQVYNQYTEEDFLVWRTLFNRQMEELTEKASVDFLKAVNDIGFTPDVIPDFIAVNKRLGSLTGWNLITVPCISPADEFFKLLSEKKFTATCWLRKFSELDYLEEPDMFHDVFGHAPLLTNKEYCEFFQALGQIALEHIENPKIILMLQRLYWFTIEFGLIEEKGKLKIYGAGIISSKNETANALNVTSKKHPFDVKSIISQDFRTDILQENYFVIESFSQLENSIADITREISKYK